MSATRADAVDVLVVGAGPAGLAAATTLDRYGVDTLLVERRASAPSLPRATVLSTRSMELVRSWGLEREVLAGGIDAEVLLWEAETLADVAAGHGHDVGFPTRAQAAIASPTAPAVVPQDWLESVLRRRLLASASVRTEVGLEVVSVEVDRHGVRATVLDMGGSPRTIEAGHLVAADGARSSVRELLGIRVRDVGVPYDGVQVVLRAPLAPVVGDHRYALYAVTTEQAPGLFVPAGRSDRWIYGSAIAPEDLRAPGADPVRLERAIRRGAGVPDLEVTIEHVRPFHSEAQLAERFRNGRAFLVGDAAHRMTPRGGTGLNTAIRSGHDLAWKLAWVVHGWADPELLDTYERERFPVAAHNVARSGDPDGSRRAAVDELHVDLGGRIAHAWLPAARGRTSTLDLLGPGWTVLAGPDASGVELDVPDGAPAIVHVLDAVTALTLGVAQDGAVLVRPDGVVAEHRRRILAGGGQVVALAGA